MESTNQKVSIHAPAGGATICLWSFLLSRRVSIHAPAGGATKSALPIITIWVVSIHAPAGGATCCGLAIVFVGISFNPRARGGRDDPFGWHKLSGHYVSIHAPAGGATCGLTLAPGVKRAFQSTRPRGARRLRQIAGVVCRRFNPRARGGRDRNIIGSR